MTWLALSDAERAMGPALKDTPITDSRNSENKQSSRSNAMHAMVSATWALRTQKLTVLDTIRERKNESA